MGTRRVVIDGKVDEGAYVYDQGQQLMCVNVHAHVHELVGYHDSDVWNEVAMVLSMMVLVRMGFESQHQYQEFALCERNVNECIVHDSIDNQGMCI